MNYEYFRGIVESAKASGLIREAVKDQTTKPVRVSKTFPKKDYGFGICTSCKSNFEKLAHRSNFCHSCRWGSRKCETCGVEFIPKSSPKRNKIIKTCSVECAIRLMSKSKKGKPAANKKSCLTTV